MAAISATKAGNWSDPTVWSSNPVLPANGDDVDLADYIVPMDIARIPATGSLASLTSPGTAGQLLVPLNTLAANVVLNALTITAGTKNAGFITTSGPAAYSLTINGVTISGGTSVGAIGVVKSGSNNTIIINATLLQGGSANLASGFSVGNIGGGGIYINSNVMGGTYFSAYGAVNNVNFPNPFVIVGDVIAQAGPGYNALYGNSSPGASIDGNIIYSTLSAPIVGCPPATMGGAGKYIQLLDGSKYALQLSPDQMLEGVVCGDQTGNYHEATEAEVQSGVHFGAGSALVGTYAASGGSGSGSLTIQPSINKEQIINRR